VNLTPLELRGKADLLVAQKFFSQPERLLGWCADRHLRFGNDLHMTADAHSFRKPGIGDLILHEGKTFHQYADHWDSPPRYSVASTALQLVTAEATLHYRLAFRDIARSNDERTMIAFIAPPGVVFGHTATVERTPGSRASADALILCALFNSFPFDWLVRQKAATHLSLYLLDALPVPRFSDTARRFLAHGALRLSCNHAGYASLWRAQLRGLPERAAMQDPAARWGLRAAMDAVVARSYGLDRFQYENLLASFSHSSRPDAARLCLSAADVLQAKGVEAFCRRHDPLHAVRPSGKVG
jgi:hypothetical protein